MVSVPREESAQPQPQGYLAMTPQTPPRQDFKSFLLAQTSPFTQLFNIVVGVQGTVQFVQNILSHVPQNIRGIVNMFVLRNGMLP